MIDRIAYRHEPAIQTRSFSKDGPGPMLWSMSSLAERITHALEARQMKRGHLDEELARRLGKKGRGTGYVHSLVVRGHQPRPENMKAIADILQVSLRWLMTGEGPMDPEDRDSFATYDSLPGWAAAAGAEVPRGRVAEYAIRAAGRSPVFVQPTEITSDFVFRCATFWLEHAPEEHRIAAMKVEAARIKADEDDKD